MSSESESATAEYTIPSDLSLQHAVKISIVKDKPIMLDYWLASLKKMLLLV